MICSPMAAEAGLSPGHLDSDAGYRRFLGADPDTLAIG